MGLAKADHSLARLHGASGRRYRFHTAVLLRCVDKCSFVRREVGDYTYDHDCSFHENKNPDTEEVMLT